MNQSLQPMCFHHFCYWGKAKPSEDDKSEYHRLVYHCLDVAAVAYEYLRQSKRLQKQLLKRFPGTTLDFWLRWIPFWIALHDLGKFAESFQWQVPELFRALFGRDADPQRQSYNGRHDSLGWWLWKEKFEKAAIDQKWFGEIDSPYLKDILDIWAPAVMGHHGQPPQPRDGTNYCKCHQYFNDDNKKAALAFCEEVKDLFLSGNLFEGVTDFKSFYKTSQQISWWIAGVTVLADWLGSDEKSFPYCGEIIPIKQYWERVCRQAGEALRNSGVIYHAKLTKRSFGELFSYVAHPSPLQKWATETQIDASPQIFILEDVTGAGKTEAAVMLAHRMMLADSAEGFYIGLPTMATANAMYDRVAKLFNLLFPEDASLALAHGKSKLVEKFADSVLPSNKMGVEAETKDATATARCNAWLADQNKRSLLAAGGVGTLDQALLGALKSKHQSLRLLGLLGKVLIIDEVHACDAYMQAVLKELLRLHAWAGGSVILLSATLTQQMKQVLLDAFASGRGMSAREITHNQYPLVTAWRETAPDEVEETPVQTRKEVTRTVKVHYLDNEELVLQQIEKELAAGRCVCWMRNTVKDAISAYQMFQDKLNPENLILFHARFALADRLAIEENILDCFGKSSTPAKRQGKLVIATQVVEQSLDADWDVVISDLAPIDRLIQRAGRLCRHVRDLQGNRLEAGQQDQRGEPILYVYGPVWQEEPEADWLKKPLPGTAAVYSYHGQMWLTAKLLQQGQMTMPDQAREFVEFVFGGEEAPPPALIENADKAEGEVFAERSQAKLNEIRFEQGYCSEGSNWLDDEKAPSRLGEASNEVVLVCWEDGKLRPWAKGKESAWAYSSLRVAERLIAQACDPSGKPWEAAYPDMLEKLPGKGKWSVVLVLEFIDGVWQGQALAQEKRKDKLTLKSWCYERNLGLVEKGGRT